MNDFLEELGESWRRAAAARGAAIEAPLLDPKLAQELLELARVAAHTQERRFAPLASYLAGVATERLRSQRPELSPEEILAYVREVRESVETG